MFMDRIRSMLIFCIVSNLLFPVLIRSETTVDTEDKTAAPETCAQEEKPIPVMGSAENKKQEGKTKMPTCPNVPESDYALDCADIHRARFKKSGSAKVWPKSRELEDAPFNVYCDMETDGGGWTVIQRRGNFSRPNDYFFRNWDDYKKGFGSIETDFWLGNDKIFALTSQRLYSARFDLKDVSGEKRYALYDVFWIDDEESKYKLHIRDYTGTAGDSMTKEHDGRMFSTKDKDNDNSNDDACAEKYKGAWWYNACHDSNLNGLYLYGKHETSSEGVNWYAWKGFYESLAETEIKIRPQNFVKFPVVNHKRTCVDAKVLDFSV